MPIIGAHVSAAGGIEKAFQRADDLNVEAIQIFGSSPRQWGVTLPTHETCTRVKEAWKNSGVKQVFLHAPYLAQIAHTEHEMREKSIAALAGHLHIANMISANGLIFHIGSGKGAVRQEAIARTVDGIQKLLAKVPGSPPLIIENSAGEGDKIGSTLEEIAEIIKGVGDKRVRVCIDTAHAYASTLIDAYTKPCLVSVATLFDTLIGSDRLAALHVNDSKVPAGARVDRHENIGEGHIGLDGFRALAKIPLFAGIAWLLEVPGFDGQGPDKRNVELLRSGVLESSL